MGAGVTGRSPRALAIVGPTAVGKSDLAVALAQSLDGEVVNADAMQVYRGMDIGTAKLPADERGGVPHHLLDVWDVRHAVSVVEFRDRARAVLADIAARGRLPILAGGSGLYLRAVLDPMDFPGTDPVVRAELEDDLARLGSAALHQRLTAVDPVAAQAILPSNGRRIVRALEVVSLTGSFAATLPPPPSSAESDTAWIGLSAPRPVLDERIAARVDRMWEQGLVEEVRGLVRDGLREGRTAARALGYRQVLDLLEGRCTEEEARAATVLATRRCARRQERWFRRDPRVRWLAYDDPDLLGQARALAGH